MSARPSRRAPLEREYEEALRAFISGGGEAALTRAYELGRHALGEAVGILDLALLHHDALARLCDQGVAADSVALSGQFLSECLSPFEMNLRAHQEHTKLLGLGEPAVEESSEIARSRDQLRAILDATSAVIYLKDTEGRYRYVNRQFEKVFGLPRAEVIGKTDEEAFPPAVARVLRENDRRVLESAIAEELEESLPEPDGTYTFISLKYPLVDTGGATHALCCVATDITERKRRDEVLRRAVRAAEEANRDLESFSYSVAHDLRAPLRSIDGFSQALLEDCADQVDEQGKRYLRYVREAAQQMAELIDGLLSLSRVTRSELHRSEVDLSTLARDVLGRLETAEPQRRVEALIAEGVTCQGDARLLRAALENLLGNAWKFTRRREHARIEFGRLETELCPVFFVRDNGAGFDMEHASKLFGVFQRLHSAEEFEGSGIGLATVKRIVRRHGGRVWAEGAVGHGATLYFTIGQEETVS